MPGLPGRVFDIISPGMHLLYLQQLLILPDSPGNTRSWEFARQWWESGWEISICTSHALFRDHPDYPDPDHFPYKWNYMGMEIHIFDVDYDHMMPFSRRIWAFLDFYRKVWAARHRFEGADAILAYTAPLSVAELGRRLAVSLKLPFFLEVGDVWPEVPTAMGIIRQPWLIRWLRKRTQMIYERAIHIFPFSPDMKSQIMASGVEGQKITPVLNGSKIESRREEALLRHPRGRLNLLYAGRIGLANDLGQILDALALLEEEGTFQVHLDIVGGGNDKERVEEKALALGLKGVVFHEEVDRLRLKRFWREADVGVISFKAIPALQANGAAKFFDYLAAGIPILINYEGWQADYLRRYNCGLSSPQGDIAAFAQNLKLLAIHPTLRMRMGGNGKRLAQTQFDRQLLARQMQDIIEKSLPTSG